MWTDDNKDHDHHHEHSEQKIHLQNLDESTENIIKKVKEALKNGEGCRVWILQLPYMNYFWWNFVQPSKFLTFSLILSILLQVYGVLDVQRVAGNFHISVHGLNIYVAQMVKYLYFFINLT